MAAQLQVLPDIVQTKICFQCKVSKPLSDFYRNKTRKDGCQSLCKNCHTQKSAKWKAENFSRWKETKAEHYKQNKIRILARQKAHGQRPEIKTKYYVGQLRRYYNITWEEYARLLREQKGVCGICAQPPEEKRKLGVDHNHKTKKIRGLLCLKCNAALGHMRDNPKLLRIAATYLELKDG